MDSSLWLELVRCQYDIQGLTRATTYSAGIFVCVVALAEVVADAIAIVANIKKRLFE